MDDAAMDSTPFPLLERGDIVALDEPWKLAAPDRYSPVLRETWEHIVRGMGDIPDRFDDVDRIPPTVIEECLPEEFRAFTHGVVVEIVSRYPAREMGVEESLVIQYEDVGGGPPRNVSLILFNPESGFAFFDDGPGVQAFVDYHVYDLTLVQKHDEVYNERDIAIRDVYSEWGIEEIAFDTDT